MPTLLDEHLVEDSLTALTDWSGNPSAISRTVSLPPDKTEDLLAEVAITAESMNHHPDIDRSGGRTTFRLRTDSEGGVTELDIYMASRIDDLVLQVTGSKEGSVAGAPTDEGMGTGETGTGRREGGAHRPDEQVVSRASQSADEGAPGDDRGGDRLEPLMNVPSASGGTIQTGLATPDDAPDEPQPGVSTPQGQGAPPAGQVDDRA